MMAKLRMLSIEWAVMGGGIAGRGGEGNSFRTAAPSPATGWSSSLGNRPPGAPFRLWSRSRDSPGFAGCATKSPMLRNGRLWGRTGPRAHFREAESSRIPGVGEARRASPQTFGAFSRLRALAQRDTLVSGVAGRYASALFSLAQDDRQTEAVAQSLSKLDALIAESPDLERLVRSPVFSASDQLKALDAILARANIDGVAANFIRLVATKRRLFFIREMIADYRKLYDESRGVIRAHATAARSLT